MGYKRPGRPAKALKERIEAKIRAFDPDDPESCQVWTGAYLGCNPAVYSNVTQNMVNAQRAYFRIAYPGSVIYSEQQVTARCKLGENCMNPEHMVLYDKQTRRIIDPQDQMEG